MAIEVRQALESDWSAISNVIMAAFGDDEGQEIVNLVTALDIDPSSQPLLSLVATVNDHVVGYILFTNTRLEHASRRVASSLLAPLAVQPEQQNQGIGGRLIKEGLKQLKAVGVELVFVLGHPGYYPKFGFSAAGNKGFSAPYIIPSEHSDAWMVQELHQGVIGHVSGQVRCADVLNDPKYWRE